MTTASEMKQLRSDVEKLAAKLESNARSHANGTADIIGFDSKDLRRIAKKAGKNLHHYFDEKSKQAAELRDAYEEGVSSHPYKSVLGALAGGLIIGALLRR